MLVDLHAIAILLSGIAPLVVILCSHGRPTRPLRQAMAPVLAIAVVGAVCACLLNLRGVPIAEWAFPVIGAVCVGLFVKHDLAFRVAGWALFLVAVVLCANGCWLLASGEYTTAPQRTKQFYQARENVFLQSSAKALRNALPPTEVLPEGPLSKVLAESDRDPRQAADLQTHWDREEIHTLWHTWYTRLHKIRAVPGEIWYPGGPVASASAKLQWKKSS